MWSVIFCGLMQATPCSVEQVFAADSSAGAKFGAALAADGGRLLVGSPGKREFAYLYEHDGRAWRESARLLADGTFVDNDLGAAVALSGARAILGGPHYDHPLQGDDCEGGVVMIFEEAGALWQRTFAYYGECDDQLGMSVAIAGDLACAGAPARQYVLVLERTNQGWQEAARLVPPPGFAAGFGSTLALHQDKLIVGAPLEREGRGPLYVYAKEMAVWQAVARLAPADLRPGDRFAAALACSGERLFVGVPGRDLSGAGSDQGELAVFRGVGNDWQLEARFSALEPEQLGEFGASLAAAASRCWIGERGTWRVHAFDWSEQGWICRQSFSATVAGGAFGGALAMQARQLALVGDALDDSLASNAGCFWTYSEELRATWGCTCETNAPCGNPWPSAGCRNSTGRGATLSACGTSSVSADDLILRAEGLPSGTSALFFMNARAGAARPFGDGGLCLGNMGSPYYRFPLRQADRTGLASQGPGLAAFSRAHFASSGAIEAGREWYFQCYYLDPQGPCASGSNLSNSLGVTFTP